MRGPTVTPLSDNGWLAKANNKDYVVQLFGAWDQEGAEKAIKGFKLSKDLQISVTERDGKAWFVVVMGPFKNKAAAQASIADLPKRVTREGPWVRSVASLRK